MPEECIRAGIVVLGHSGSRYSPLGYPRLAAHTDIRSFRPVFPCEVPMIRVLLADDQQLIREALAALLGLEIDLEIVGQVDSGDEVLGAVALLKPDVVLLDVQMPGVLLSDGIEVAAAIRDTGVLSESGEPVRTLIVTTFGRPGYVRRALEAGASGFLVKDTGACQLAEAIRRVYVGLWVVDPSLAADSLATGESPLTEREAQVLRQAAAGGTARQIASELFLSAGTVRNYLSAAMAKTGASTRQDAVRIATENGWL